MIFTFSLTLAAGVVSKGATFFMISQSAAQVTIDACPTSFLQFIPPKNDSVTTVSPTETERIGWIWSIFFCFLAGEVWNFIRNVLS